jgi:methanogen homocitrate synthase
MRVSLESGPWVGDGWWVSHLNYARDVTKHFDLPAKVEIYDVTLRDGEQAPGVVFRKEEKLEIARLLDEVGVRRIEAGMPVVSDEDAAAVKAIAHAGLNARVFGFCRMVIEDVEAALKTDVQGVVIEGPVGIPKLKQFGWSQEEVVKRAIDTIDFAKAHGLQTAFFSVDMTRANMEFIKRLLSQIAAETKVDSFVIVDTFGCAFPETIVYMVKEIKQIVKQPLEIHCHNDFGLGTACTLAAVAAGASVAHTSVNGIGERTGNVSFEEVVMGLRFLYGIKLDVRFERLVELSKLVERYSRLNVPSNKPFVGDRSFTREAGISIAGWIKYNLGSEPILPELVGNKHGIMIGKKSGKHSIEWKLGELGLHVPQEKVPDLLDAVKDEAMRTKAPVEDETFKQIVKRVLSVN